MEVEFPAVVFREERFYVAFCPINSVASQGKTVEEALKNLKEALELYYEDGEARLPERVESPLLTTVKVECYGKASTTLRTGGY